MNSVTVVIPVYKDWNTLSNCIESLKKYLHENNKVMLINDMGDEWEELEIHIMEAIFGFDNYVYRKNRYNVGFVETCNKAVLEWDTSENDILLLNSDTEVTEGFLEEMQRILYMDDKTGIVCPRSNNATFLSVPVQSNGIQVTPRDSYKIYQQIKEFLPEKEECWTGVGFAFLIKRKIIQEIGLFDKVFGKGYNEENDFCMRARERGYRIMKANRSYVFHMGRVSFQKEADELELKNSSILLRKYPDYWEKAEEFKQKIDVVDYYADILTDVIYEKKRILIALLDDMETDDLKKIIRQCECNRELNKYNYEIVVSKNNRRKVKRFCGKKDIFYPGNLKGTYHIAYSLSELDMDKKMLLRRYSPVTVITENIQNLKIDRDAEQLRHFDGFWVDDLRREWKEGLNRVKENHRGTWIKGVKKYLYIHHIWMFILWNRMRNGRKAWNK